MRPLLPTPLLPSVVQSSITEKGRTRPLPSPPKSNLRLPSSLYSPPPPCLLSGHKGPFLFAEPKEAGCQGDRSRNSRELAMGEGLCPQTAVSGSSPSWDWRVCLSGRKHPQENTCTPPWVSTGYFPWGLPASRSKNAPIANKTRTLSVSHG